MSEIFKDIPGYEGSYQASTEGRIKSIINNLILKPNPGQQRYFAVALYKNTKRKDFKVHRLVCLTFNDNPLNKKTVNHINRIKTDNRSENLEWCTNRENSTHHYKLNRPLPTGVLKYFNKFKVQIDINGKKHYLGLFSTVEEARDVYLKACP